MLANHEWDVMKHVYLDNDMHGLAKDSGNFKIANALEFMQ